MEDALNVLKDIMFLELSVNLSQYCVKPIINLLEIAHHAYQDISSKITNASSQLFMTPTATVTQAHIAVHAEMDTIYKVICVNKFIPNALNSIMTQIDVNSVWVD